MTDDGLDGSIGKEKQRDGTIRFRARLFVEGKRKSLGLYDTYDEAEHALAAGRELRGAKESGTTLRAYAEAWFDARELSGEVRGIKKERSCWRTHVERLDITAMAITRIKRHHVIKALDQIKAGPSKPKEQTIKHARRLIVGVLEAAHNAGLVGDNQARGTPRLKKDRRTEEPWTWLTSAELARLFALPVHDPKGNPFAKGGRKTGTITSFQRTVHVVATYAGLRAGELWGLRRCDVILDGDRPELVVCHSRAEATKSGRVRRVPLLAPAAAALEAWFRIYSVIGEALIFPGKRGRCHVDGYDAQWKRVRKLAQIERKPRPRFHDLRHTCASHLLQGTWGRAWRLEEVQMFLGHESIVTTQRYAHLSPGGLSDAARATPAWLPQLAASETPAAVVPLRAPRPSARRER
jgi:integrase